MNSVERRGRRSILSLLTPNYQLTKLREKLWQNSIMHRLLKMQTFLKLKTNIIFRLNELDPIIWNCLGSHLELSTVSFDLNCSVLYLTSKRSNFFLKID